MRVERDVVQDPRVSAVDQPKQSRKRKKNGSASHSSAPRSSSGSSARRHKFGDKRGTRTGRGVSEQVGGSQSEKHLLYVIEDSTEFWPTIQIILEDLYNLRFIEDLETASRALEREPLPAGLLVDIIFPPDQDAGLKFVEGLRPTLPALPVVFISARDDYRAGMRAAELGAGYACKNPGEFPGDLKEELARLIPESVLDRELLAMSRVEDLVFEIYGRRFADCSRELQEILHTWFVTMATIGPRVDRLAEVTGKSEKDLRGILKEDFPAESLGQFLLHLCTCRGALLYRSRRSARTVCSRIGMSRERFYENCKIQLFLRACQDISE